MTIDFYYMPLSAPCRGVMLTAKAIGVEMNYKPTNLMKGEHITPEFLKMNPQHTIPTMDDSGLCLNESRAMVMYLMNRYAPDSPLYPKDPKKRALVDQKIFFDQGCLYQSFMEYVYPVVIKGTRKTVDPTAKEKFDEILDYLDGYLKKGYVCGEDITVADFCCVASVATFQSAGVDMSRWPHVCSWLRRCKDEIRGYSELNQAGADMFGEMVKQKVKL